MPAGKADDESLPGQDFIPAIGDATGIVFGWRYGKPEGGLTQIYATAHAPQANAHREATRCPVKATQPQGEGECVVWTVNGRSQAPQAVPGSAALPPNLRRAGPLEWVDSSGGSGAPLRLSLRALPLE
jgi:hypothetical protein